MIKFLAVKADDGRAIHHPNAGAIAIKILPLMTDLPEAPEPSCACCNQIARQFGRPRRTLWEYPDDHRHSQRRQFSSGCLNSTVRSCVTSGNLRRPVTSQSTQRNLRPPVFTSTNRIGLLHFGQIGGGVFLGIGSPFHQGGSSTLAVTDNSRKRETVINHPAPFNGPIASQFRAIDTVFRHSAISS